MNQQIKRDHRHLISIIKALRPNSPRKDFICAKRELRRLYPEKGLFAERHPYGAAIHDVQLRRYTGAAALNRRGLISHTETSRDDLVVLRERLLEENQDIDLDRHFISGAGVGCGIQSWFQTTSIVVL